MRPTPALLLRTRTRALALATIGLAVVATACDTGDGRELRPPTAPPPVTTAPPVVITEPPLEIPTTTVPAGFRLVASWRDGAPIAARHTCDGADVSPGLSWTGVPDGTAELAVVVRDDDADGFVHWAVTGIAPTAAGLLEGEVPPGAVAARNGVGVTGWSGPCPPEGPPHRYRVTLHALNQQVEGADGIDGTEVVRLVEELSIETATLFGTYSRAPST